MKKCTLIVPFAAPQQGLSYLVKEGGEIPLIVRSLCGLEQEAFERVCVVLLAKDSRSWQLIPRLQTGFIQAQWKIKPEFLELDEVTANQPETIACALRKLEISGSFWVKDPDNFFRSEVVPENTVTAFPLDALSKVNPQNKSYLSISDADYVMNIAEKRIIGRYFCAGGYGFSDAVKYLEVFDSLKHLGHLYLSHIIYKMLLDGEIFRPVYVSEYQDWGTAEDWRASLEKHK